jgi:hypothetical protein
LTIYCFQDDKDDHSDKHSEDDLTNLQERKLLEQQIVLLQDQVKLRDKRIEELENILDSNKERVSTQVDYSKVSVNVC